MFKTRHFTGQTLTSGASHALGAQLYHQGWRLQQLLEDVVADKIASAQAHLVIGYENEQPVSLAFCDGFQAMVFCNPLFRGQGHTQQCWDLLRQCYPEKKRFWVGQGNDASLSFWKKQGFKVEPHLESSPASSPSP